MNTAHENWNSGAAYERWVGRWSRVVTRDFLDRLPVPAGVSWADVGCGTGALSEAILSQCAPREVRACDRAAGYVEHAAARSADPRVRYEVGDALALPWPDARFEAVVSGLVLNFVPDAARMAAEMVRVARPGGVVAAYVWDYGGGMQMMRRFWDVVLELRPQDAASDQAERFPICEPGVLEALWKSAGLRDVRAGPLEFDMVFDGFDDYWLPFLGRQGSAPTYLATLPESEQAAIRETLRLRLTAATDGTIHLRGRAWAVQGHRECSCEGR